MTRSDFEQLRLADLQLVSTLAATASFTQTAEALGMARSSVSRRMAEIEGRLGQPLFDRATREPTAAGRRFLEHANPALDAARDALDAVRQRDGLRGSITVSAPPVLSGLVMVPAIVQLLRDNPEATVAFDSRASFVDLELERVDVALRLGEDDRGFEGDVLGQVPFWLVSTVSDLDRPDQLKEDRILGARPIRLRRGSREVRLSAWGCLRTQDYGALMAAAEAGLGLARLPWPMVAGAVRDGRLHRACRDWDVGASTLRCLVRKRARPLAHRLARHVVGSPRLAMLLGKTTS